MKPLDIVKHESGNIGMITEGRRSFSITWFDVKDAPRGLMNAWW